MLTNLKYIFIYLKRKYKDIYKWLTMEEKRKKNIKKIIMTN